MELNNDVKLSLKNIEPKDFTIFSKNLDIMIKVNDIPYYGDRRIILAYCPILKDIYHDDMIKSKKCY